MSAVEKRDKEVALTRQDVLKRRNEVGEQVRRLFGGSEFVAEDDGGASLAHQSGGRLNRDPESSAAPLAANADTRPSDLPISPPEEQGYNESADAADDDDDDMQEV